MSTPELMSIRPLASAEHLAGAREAEARRLTDGDMPV
jgi:hypothetical protein